MNIKELTPEMLEKAKQAATADELMSLAAENGITLPSEEANEAFARLHPDGALADTELENVAGGDKMIKITKTVKTKPFGPC